MDKDKGQRDAPTAKADNAHGRASAEAPFDAWLRKQLHEMYDEIASEPLPASLLSLIENDVLRTSKSTDTPKTPGDKKK
jgi:hypothetical protein